MTFSSTSFDVQSVERSTPGSDLQVLKAGDGCLCVFTVSECDDLKSRFELCAICSAQQTDAHQTLCANATTPITAGVQYQLCLGQAPDLAPGMVLTAHDQTKHSSFRSLLECALLGSIPGEIVTVKYKRTGASTNPDSVFSVSLQIDRIEYPPRCARRNNILSDPQWSDEGTSAFTGGKKDPLENPTNDWNPELTVHWAVRAWALKERGTWLVQRHTGKQKGTTLPSSDSIRSPWGSGFACYSRALQLVTLARLAQERCFSEPSVDDAEKRTAPTQHDSGPVDLDRLPESGPVEFDLSVSGITRLEFNVLLNLALCQLKAGNAEFAGDNCSQALTLDPGWVAAVSDEAAQHTRIRELVHSSVILNNSDVAKALYRRAQAYLRTGKTEEAKLDAQNAVRLYSLTRLNDAGDGPAKTPADNTAAITACEALITQAVERISRDKDILVERIRKRRNEF